MNPIDISNTQEIYTVSRLNREVRFLLEGSFPPLWVEGEISGFIAHSSGHWYFSLKDSTAVISCAMFNSKNRALNFTPKNGMHVVMKAQISLYEGAGRFQLLVDHMEEAGLGKLQKEFEALKKKLQAAGLFDVAHKKSLPRFPEQIGIITSPTGAAVRDILNILKRRFACAPILIYPTLVQGELAAANIVSAIQTANRRKECDVLILARGGGSIEDLWPFNDERVAHAIYQSEIPIVSGVGHEIDFTIADFVADLRAPTPSAAAELVVVNCEELLKELEHHTLHLYRQIKQKLQHFQQNIVWVKKHLQQQHPKRRLVEQQQRLDFCEVTLLRLQNKFLQMHQANLNNLQMKIKSLTPLHQIRHRYQELNLHQQYFQHEIVNALESKRQMLIKLSAQLDTLSPLATLTRGYAIATRTHDGKVLRKASEVNVSDEINLRLMEGSVHCVVKSKI